MREKERGQQKECSRKMWLQQRLLGRQIRKRGEGTDRRLEKRKKEDIQGRHEEKGRGSFSESFFFFWRRRKTAGGKGEMKGGRGENIFLER